MDRGSDPQRPAIGASESSSFLSFVKVRLLPVDLFNHKNRKILQGVAFGIKMSSDWLVQKMMFNIWSMAIHSYVKHILSFTKRKNNTLDKEKEEKQKNIFD